MNRFAKIMQVLGWLGVALLVGVWAQGFSVSGEAPRLAQHSTIAIVAAGLCILPRFWTIAYLHLAARGRAARRRSGAAMDAMASARADRLRRLAYLASGMALAGLAGSFALAGAVVLRRTSPMTHAAASLAALALQAVALWLERRALLADSSEMAALQAAQPAANPTAPAVANLS